MSNVTARPYAITRTVAMPYEKAVDRVKGALKEQGFGVLTEIDVKKTMKEKLGADFEPYVILGACNPPLAHRALTAERNVGLLLPCNVVVRATSEEKTVVSAADPVAMLEIAHADALRDVAREARERLVRVLESL